MLSFGQKSAGTIPSDAPGLYSLQERADQTPVELLCEFNACIVGKNGSELMIAALNPSLPALRQYAKQHLSDSVTWYTAQPSDITKVMRMSKVDHKKEIERLFTYATTDETSISRVVSYMMQYAFSQSASDIHLEPRKREVTVRFRIDGVLREMFLIPIERYAAIVARIKILAQLRTDETRNPQDGRIEPEGYDGSSLRVSVMPSLYGEKIVMRILDESSSVLKLGDLGFSEEHIDIVKRNIEKPFGLIVASGPTGSGKTTTLYALLQMLDTKTLNITTLEDPIEYALSGVTQTQVYPDRSLTFATGLRSLLRQDPDVILVGELRDHETANMAAQASMTGHLVLTSMHTNDSSSAFPRFIEMGVEEFMIVTTVNLIIAQRLVRKLCVRCKTEAPLTPAILEKLQARFDISESLKALDARLIKSIQSTSFAHATGCEHCMNTGYSGRMGIYELLEMTPEIHDAVLSGKSAEDIRTIAHARGFRSMVTDGVAKVLAGHTTFEEVIRTTRTN